MTGLLLILCAAAEPLLSVPVGQYARASEMPDPYPGVTELLLRRVEGDLTILRGRKPPGIANMDAASQGSGHWTLRIQRADPSTQILARIVDGALLLEVVPRAEQAPYGPTPSVDALLEGGLPETIPDPMPPLRFLHGDALAFRMEPRDHPMDFAPPPQTERDLDAARKAMLRARRCGEACEDEHAEALYELGWLYLQQGWDREAYHYLSFISDHPGALEPTDVALSQAHAALRTRRDDVAMERLLEAWQLGAGEDLVVEGIALVSLSTGTPSRTHTARALLAASEDPLDQLLASELLQLDGRFEESLPILEGLFDELADEEEARQHAALRLGDAFLLSGNIDQARRYWQHTHEDIAVFRVLFGELSRLGSMAWITISPQLRELSRRRDSISPEALYLLSRIDTELGDELDAIDDLTQLIDGWPVLSERSDAPSLLWELYVDRTERLYDEEAWYRLAALHEIAWRPILSSQIDDPDVLWKIAQAYEALGLPRQATEVLSIGLEAVIAAEQTRPDMTLHLARLYEQSGACRDGLETLDFLDESRAGLSEAELALMRGRMLVACQDLEASIAPLRQARRDPATAAEATRLLATLDAWGGRCRAAVGPLQEALMGPDPDWRDPAAGLALSRCLAELGRTDEAMAAAEAFREHVSPGEMQQYAEYLAAIYGAQSEDPPDEADIWSELTRSRTEADDLDALLESRQGKNN